MLPEFTRHTDLRALALWAYQHTGLVKTTFFILAAAGMLLPMTSETLIALISGAGLDIWVWDKVRGELAAPTLVVNRSPNTEATLSDHVQAAIEQIEAAKAQNVVLVCHSIGGAIGVEVAKQLPKRIAAVCYVTAIIPQPGKSYVASLPFPQNLITGPLLRVAGTKPPEKIIMNGMCNDVSEADTRKLLQSFTPETKGLYLDKTTATPLPMCPSLYVHTSQDKTLPQKVQQRMATAVNAETTHLRSGHLPMLSQPKELSRAINDFVAQL